MKDVLLFDRIKELTHITSTNDIVLEGAAAGFSAFSDYMSIGDYAFYAITDGSSYEVGSGVLTSSTNLTREPIRTSNGDNSIVSFPAGLKEVYATYPGAFAVISNPLDAPQQNRESGITYWSGPQTIDSDNLFVWDESNKRLGINTSRPLSALHVDGNNITSELRVSGIVLGASGIDFANAGVGYFSGRQREPFIKNSLCENTSGILELSGDVDQVICFSSQVAGTFLGVASGECPDGCVDAHPVFRTLTVSDIPNLSGLYLTQDQYADKNLGNVAFYKQDKNITYSDSLRFDTSVNPDELIVSGNIRFAEPSHWIYGSNAEFNTLETKFTEGSVSQIVSNTGVANNSSTENVIVNDSGVLVVPTYNLVSDVVSQIPAQNLGAIAFATGDSYIMIANGTSWVSGQLN